jgi:hypothetical protein
MRRGVHVTAAVTMVVPTMATPGANAPRVNWAFLLASRGLPVHPLYWVTPDGVCSCGATEPGHKSGKHPMLKGWQSKATTDADEIRSMWERSPLANVGIETTGLIVVDFDGDEGQASGGRIEEVHGAFPKTFAQATGGGGLHLFFRKPEGVTIRNSVGKLGAGIGGRIAGKTKVDIRADGGNLVGAGSNHVSGTNYTVACDAPIADAPAWLVAELLRIDAAAPPVTRTTPAHPTRDEATAVERARLYARTIDIAISGAGGHTATFEAAQKIVRGFELTEEAAFEVLWDEWNPRCDPPWDEKELRRKVHQAAEKGTLDWGRLLRAERPARGLQPRLTAPHELPAVEPSAAPASEPREIWPTVEIAQTVTESIEALRADSEIFVRGGKLTRVIESDGTDYGPVTRDMGAPVTRLAVPQWITERLSVHAHFMKTKTEGRGAKKQEIAVRMPPPSWIGMHVIARGTWPGFRALTGVVTSPTMRRDGSVLQEPGYDRESGLLYIPRGTYARVADVPSKVDAVRARNRLLEVVDDFPLSELASAGWLALVLTLTARDLIEGSTPLFGIDAPVPGAGKGLLARCAHLIPYGVDIAHMSLPPDDEEMRKQITTLLLSGDPAVLLDNVGIQIGGDSLESLITAPLWKVRLLGKNEDSGALVPRLVVVAAGNGLQFVGDMGRRSVRIRLDTPHESPEERDDYTHPERGGADRLLAWVRANRTTLVIDALTILRAWHVEGRGGEVKPWGSFESWASTIGRCVQWLGLPDPTLARATQDAALDPQRQALAVVYEAIGRLGAESRGVTLSELVRAAYPIGPEPAEEDLAEAIGMLCPNSRDAASRARTLGRKLNVGRIINGCRLDAVTGHARVVRYSLVEVGK